MAVEAFIIWLIVGAIAGWLAATIVKGYGLGLVGNIVVGIVGAFVGGWLFPQLGFATGEGAFSTTLGGAMGAVILLLTLGLIRRSA